MTVILGIPIALLISACVIQSARVVLRARKNERAKEALLNRIKQLRFYKMLNFLGVDQKEYIDAVPAADVDQQIHRCSHCNALDACDCSLRDGKWITNLNFCPNHDSILKHSDTVYRHRLK